MAVMVPVPSAPGLAPFQQSRQFGKDRGGITACDRRFARSHRHLADRMGKSRHAVDDEKDIIALIAKMLGDGNGGKRCHLAQHRAFVARRDDGDGLAHILAHRIFDELAHFASAFTDKRNHHLVEGVGLGEHR